MRGVHMNEALNKVLCQPDSARKMEVQGINVIGRPLEVAKVFIEKQMDIWAKGVKDKNIKAE